MPKWDNKLILGVHELGKWSDRFVCLLLARELQRLSNDGSKERSFKQRKSDMTLGLWTWALRHNKG